MAQPGHICFQSARRTKTVIAVGNCDSSEKSGSRLVADFGVDGSGQGRIIVCRDFREYAQEVALCQSLHRRSERMGKELRFFHHYAAVAPLADGCASAERGENHRQDDSRHIHPCDGAHPCYRVGHLDS